MGRPAGRGSRLQVEASSALRYPEIGRWGNFEYVGFRCVALLVLGPSTAKKSCRAGGSAGTPASAAPA